MKTKITYVLLLLLCCTLGASPNKNVNVCEALTHCARCATALPEPDSSREEAEAKAAIPAVTGFLPGYSIILMN